MVISDSNLSTSVFTDVRTVIVAVAPYVTNSITSATEAASINAVYNDKTPQRPQIVIYPQIGDESNFKFNSSEGKKLINVPVEVYYHNTLGIDQMDDQISAAIKSVLFIGMDLVGIQRDYAFNVGNQNKYHMKTIVYSFDRE